MQVFPLTVPNVQVSKYSAPAVSSTTHTAFLLAPKDLLTYVHVFAYTSNFSSVIGLHQCFPPPFQPSSRLLSFRIGITLCVRLCIPVLFRVNAFRFLRKSPFPRELVLLTDSLQRSLTLWKLSRSAFTRFVLVRFHLYPGCLVSILWFKGDQSQLHPPIVLVTFRLLFPNEASNNGSLG